jgi:hypothetical protein
MADSLPRIRSTSFLPSSHRQYRRACGHIERGRPRSADAMCVPDLDGREVPAEIKGDHARVP